MNRDLTLNEVYRASHVLKSIIRPTNLQVAPAIHPGCEVYIKPENLQVTGSFKVRGASYMISQLTDEEKQHGVIACSAGNHAQRVALAAGAGHQVYDLSACRCSNFKGRGNAQLWCGDMSCPGRVR